jgi:fatty acid desaturase
LGEKISASVPPPLPPGEESAEKTERRTLWLYAAFGILLLLWVFPMFSGLGFWVLIALSPFLTNLSKEPNSPTIVKIFAKVARAFAVFAMVMGVILVGLFVVCTFIMATSNRH